MVGKFTKIEEKAISWLRNNGCFRGVKKGDYNGLPDLVTNSGFFEIKKLLFDCINLTPKQKKKFPEYNPTLVIMHPFREEPILIRYNELLKRSYFKNCVGNKLKIPKEVLQE